MGFEGCPSLECHQEKRVFNPKSTTAVEFYDLTKYKSFSLCPSSSRATVRDSFT